MVVSCDELFELYVVRGLSTWEIARLLNLSQSTVLYHLRKCGIKTRDRIEAIREHYRREGRYKGDPTLEEKMYMIGLAQTDCAVRRDNSGRIRLAVLSTRNEICTIVLETFSKYAHYVKDKLRQIDGVVERYIELILPARFSFLLEYKQTMKVPEECLKDYNLASAYIAGILDGDGVFVAYLRFRKDRGYHTLDGYIGISNKNLQWLTDIKRMLENYEIKNVNITKKEKIIKGRNVLTYMLIIRRKEDIRKLAEMYLKYGKHPIRRLKAMLLKDYLYQKVNADVVLKLQEIEQLENEYRIKATPPPMNDEARGRLGTQG